MTPRLTPFPVGGSSVPLLTDDLTAWASNGWVATGDAVIVDCWGDADHIRLFVEMLGFWGNNPEVEQSPGARSTRLTKTYGTADGLTPNRFVIVKCDVAFYAQDFGAAGKFVGMYVNDATFAPNVAASGTVTPALGQIVGFGMTNGAGEIEIAFGCENITVSCDLHIQFDNIEFTTPAAELADIYYDAGAGYIANNPFSITRGGGQFDPQEEIDDYEFPGKRAPVQGCDEVVRCRPILRTRFMLTGEYQFQIYRPGGSWGDHASIENARTYTPDAMGAALANGVYIQDFVFVWPRQRGDYIAVHFPVALVRRYGMGSLDKDEGTIEVEIEARIPAGEPIATVPYRIHTYAAGTTTVG